MLKKRKTQSKLKSHFKDCLEPTNLLILIMQEDDSNNDDDNKQPKFSRSAPIINQTNNDAQEINIALLIFGYIRMFEKENNNVIHRYL